MNAVKQSTTTYHLTFFLASSTDHVTGITGQATNLTTNAVISKNAGSFAAAAGAVTEIANGWYKWAANATDRNTLGELVFHSTATGADPVDFKVDVVAYDPTGDAVRGTAGTALPNAVASASGGLLTFGTGTGQINTDGGGRPLANLVKVQSLDVNYYSDNGLASLIVVADDAGTPVAVAGDAMTLTAGERTTLAGVFWDKLTSGVTAVGSIGKWILDKLDVAVSTRNATTPPTAQENADALLGTTNGAATVGEQLEHLDADVSAAGGGSLTEDQDDKLTAIFNKTESLNPGSVTAVSPVAEDGSLTIYQGDDYLLTDAGRPLEWTLADYAGPDLTDATVTFKLLRGSAYGGDTTEADLTVTTGTITTAGANRVIKVPLTSAQTAALAATSGVEANYRYHLKVTLSNGNVITEGFADATVRKRIN